MTAAQAWKWVAKKKAEVTSWGIQWRCGVAFNPAKPDSKFYYFAFDPLAVVKAAAKAMEDDKKNPGEVQK